jgi:ribonuclease Z
MELTFLGTSSGVPTKIRNVSGLALRKQASKHWYLVDCGEGTQHQLLKTNLSLKHLRAICITHVHGDHCYGLPGLLATTAMSGRTEPMTIIAPKGIRAFISAVIETTDIHLSYEINFVAVEELNSPMVFEEFDVDQIELSHRVPSFGYSFVENNISRKLDIAKLESMGVPRGPLWGKLQIGETIILDNDKELKAEDCYLTSEAPRKVIICGDNDTPNLITEASSGANLVVHEATYTEEISKKVGPDPQHSCAKTVAEFAESIKLKNLILTHFSARYQPDRDKPDSIDDIENEARERFSGNLFIANDLDVYQLDKQGCVKRVHAKDKKAVK